MTGTKPLQVQTLLLGSSIAVLAPRLATAHLRSIDRKFFDGLLSLALCADIHVTVSRFWMSDRADQT